MGYLQALVVSQVDVQLGRVIYTPLLNAAGGVFADLTIIRLAHDHYRVVTGGGMGMRDKKWFADHLPADGSAQLSDLTSALYTVGVWGPRARPRPVGRGRRPVERGVPLRDGSRPSTSAASAPDVADLLWGELGWEIYCPMELGLRLWDTSGKRAGRSASPRSGSASTQRPAGSRRGTGPTGRAGARVRPGRGGHGPAAVKDAEFVGKAAYLEQRAHPPAAIL
jgi:glycine cleavage system aminomethyltransferase T